MSYQKLYWGLVPFYVFYQVGGWYQTLESQLKAMKTERKGFYMYTELQQPLLQFCTNNSGVLRGGGTSPLKLSNQS